MNTSLWGLCNRNWTTVIITAQKSTIYLIQVFAGLNNFGSAGSQLISVIVLVNLIALRH